jgi:hypothetical protein
MYITGTRQIIHGLIVVFALSALRNLTAETVSFNRDIRPILSDRCFSCHGPDDKDRKAHLRLDQADGPEGAYRTHDDSTAITPGSLADSALWYRITTTDEDEIMPPPKSHKEPLSAAELEHVKQWIEAGAKYENFWAFEPPEKPSTPKGKAPIDALVQEALTAKGLKPSNEADRRTLVRRLTVDLTGLPPTRDEVHAFLADASPNAYVRLVDALLARPQYGEHMARYWLDLVRFADTNGMHKDFYRNFVSYRNWVIRAFNENLSYDDFLRYQLAGDLFEEPTKDQLVASGFNRLHLIIDLGTALPEESYTKNVVDRVTAVGTAFLGLTVQCAMCHDHKYDPFTQKDFYALFAFFNNIDADPETRGAPSNGLQPPFVHLTDPEERREHDALLAELESLHAVVVAADKAEKEHKAKRPETANVDLAHADNQDLALAVKAHDEMAAQLSQTTKTTKDTRNAKRKRRQEIEKGLSQAMVMKERTDIRPAFMLNRGQYDDPGEEVQRNTPAFLPPLNPQGEIPSRMDLANWFVDPSHPLTARVAANRIWQQFFGVGLVKTSEDLGAQGEVPSHPELLDYLAVTFMNSNWDSKALVKEIVLSETYRQSSLATPEQYKNDAENRLLARASRYRMDAEMIRDLILATSGRLSKKMYGPSVKPPQPPGLWAAVSMTRERFKADEGEAIVRRSMYTYWRRGMPPPQMTILNAPNRDACIARRERTNSPTQALLLLNETEYLLAARHLAKQAIEAIPDNANERLDYTWETITAALPDAQERDTMLTLVTDLEKVYTNNSELTDALCEGLDLPSIEAKAELAAWTLAVNTLYNLDITKTRE